MSRTKTVIAEILERGYGTIKATLGAMTAPTSADAALVAATGQPLVNPAQAQC
jgi:hypothetical protein